MSDRRDVLGDFRDRLTTLLDEQGLSQAELSRRAGIDRSTLSQLLSSTNRRLPRVETLVAIAQASGASIDWLMGLSNEGQATTDIVPEELAVARGELTDLDETLIGWFRAARGMKIRYIPASLPDLVKTEAVIRYETGRFATIYSEQKIETANAPLEMARAPGSDVECLNSIQAIRGFVFGQEVWAALPLTDRIEQLDRMIELSEELYPTFRWFLYDARQRFASATTIFGMERVLLYLGQMYIVLSNYDHITSFVAQFDDLIRAAVVQPPDVPTVLRELRAQVAA